MPFKVMSYNIREGGDGRLPLLADTIRDHSPDVVALLEASNRVNVETIAADLEMHLTFGEANNPVGHIAWLSRAPVSQSRNHRHPGLAKTVLEITVRAEDRPIHLFATHLASRWDAPRPVDEIPIILQILQARAGQARILVGDLNALRPGDPVGVPPEGVEKRGDAVDGAPRPAIQLLIDAGYVDCYRTLHPANPGYTYPSSDPWLRLDYVFASSEVVDCLTSCEVVDRARAVEASDHLPVWAQFQWS